MTIRVEDATREQVANFVPVAIQKAVDSYHGFMGREVQSDPKKFAEHHSAGKVAIAHIQLLLKLAQWADVETGDSGAKAEHLLQAKDEANAFRYKEVPCEDGEDS